MERAEIIRRMIELLVECERHGIDARSVFDEALDALIESRR